MTNRDQVLQRTTAANGDTLEVVSTSANDLKFKRTVKATGVVTYFSPDLSAELATLGVPVYRAPSFVLGRQITSSFAARGATSSNFTYHTTTTVEAEATRFRVCLHNLAATTCQVALSSIAVSNAIGADVTYGATTGQARFTPSTATWVPITWSGAASVTLAACVSATEASITWSDWINISTIARTDGGTLPVVMMRFYVPSNGTTNAYTTGSYDQLGKAWEVAANTSVHAGRIWNSIRYTGDGITSPDTFQPTTDLGYVFMAGFEYASVTPGVTFCGVGDSIHDGAVNTGLGNYGNGWLWQAVKLLRKQYPNTPIEFLNSGWAGQYSSYYFPRVASLIAAGSAFDVMVYEPATPNDAAPTAAIVLAEKALLARAATQVQAAGKSFVINTPFPNTAAAWTAGQDAFRTAFRSAMLAYPGMAVIDVESVGDGASPARYKVANTTDGTHPNEVGHGVVAAVAAPVLARFVPQ